MTNNDRSTLMTGWGKQRIEAMIADMEQINIPECIEGIERAIAMCDGADLAYYQKNLDYYKNQIDYWKEALTDVIVVPDDFEDGDTIILEGSGGQMVMSWPGTVDLHC